MVNQKNIITIHFGHNYRMEGIQGAVLGVKLKYLASWTDGRRKVAAKYKELLGKLEHIIGACRIT